VSARILQVFNRYLFPGGEEKSVDRIFNHLSERHEMSRCFYESAEWKAPGAPGPLGQVRRLFSNPEGRARFEKALAESHADVAMFHNIYPVGSPALYHAARDRHVPVIQYLHNFRPFSVGGALFVNGRVNKDSLHGSFTAEILAGVWQGSVLKTALFALMLKLLHRSGALSSVKAWVAISEFMRQRILEGGWMPPERIHTLRHSWDAMRTPPPVEDAGFYLFLGRLVPEKGLKTLLEAWDRLRAVLGPKTPPLHIAGEGPEEALVREKARQNPYIVFLGQIGGSVKNDELRQCRALIAPSVWWEPLGLVTYEAYDFSKPVLAASSGGFTETVIPGQTGLLHTPGDAESLTQDVLTLENLIPTERAVWGLNGRRWLLQNASVEAWKDRFEGVLESVRS
jgi:glycosyltransferase involved in cell wall biosynthesis